MRLRIAVLIPLAASFMMLAKGKNKTEQRLDDAVAVISEIIATPDKGIPLDLLDKSQCMVIVPGLKKGAFIIGAKYGKGFITCRKSGGEGWGAPAAIRVEGGSVGFQIGGAETDLVMLVLNARGKEKLMSSKFTLGGEGEVAAGPVGRDATAQTDATMRAEILSWSRSRGGSLASRCREPLCGRISMTTKNCTARRNGTRRISPRTSRGQPPRPSWSHWL